MKEALGFTTTRSPALTNLPIPPRASTALRAAWPGSAPVAAARSAAPPRARIRRRHGTPYHFGPRSSASGQRPQSSGCYYAPGPDARLPEELPAPEPARRDAAVVRGLLLGVFILLHHCSIGFAYSTG